MSGNATVASALADATAALVANTTTAPLPTTTTLPGSNVFFTLGKLDFSATTDLTQWLAVFLVPAVYIPVGGVGGVSAQSPLRPGATTQRDVRTRRGVAAAAAAAALRPGPATQREVCTQHGAAAAAAGAVCAAAAACDLPRSSGGGWG